MTRHPLSSSRNPIITVVIEKKKLGVFKTNFHLILTGKKALYKFF